MTTIDTARLRALAEATQEVESVGAEWHSVEGFHEDCGLDIRDAEYLAAIDPPTLVALLDRLEAADRRAENAERQVEIRQSDSIAARIARQNARAVEEWVRLNQERDQFATALEKVRGEWAAIQASIPMRQTWEMNDILATAPADALAEHDAALIDSLIEGIGSGTYTHQVGEGIEVALDQLHAAKGGTARGRTEMSDIDRLAQEIRRLDERGGLRAEVLAEDLGPFIEAVRAEEREKAAQIAKDVGRETGARGGALAGIIAGRIREQGS